MNRNWLAIVVVLLACGGGGSGNITVAGEGAAGEAAPSLAISATGQVAVAWTHLSSDGVTSVRVARLDGTAWTQLGGDLSPTGPYALCDPDPQIAFQPDGTLLLKAKVEVSPGDWSGDLVVRRWTGTAWEVIGGVGGPTEGQSVSRARMVIDSGGAPIVAADLASQYSAETSLMIVRRWDGTSWAQVGSDSVFAAPEGARFYDLLLDASDRLAVFATKYDSATSTLTLARWDGAAWQELPGMAGTRSLRLALDTTGALLAATQTTTGITINRLDGTAWSSSEATRAVEGRAEFGMDMPIVVDSSGGVLVGWQERPIVPWYMNWSTKANTKNYVRRWTGEKWVSVLEGFDSGSGGFLVHIQMALGGPFDTDPVVAWVEDSYDEPVSRLYVRVPH
jgi:hypothetical protein